MRDVWLSRIRSRLDGTAGPYAVLEGAALTEAVQLVASTVRAGDLLETCHAVGLLHWSRAAALADERAINEVHTATPFLIFVRASGERFAVPESVPALAALPGEPWEQIFALLEPWLGAGGDPHFLLLAVGIARNAVAAAEPGHPLRASRLTFLNAAAQRVFEQTGDVAALDEAIAAGRAAVAGDPGSAGCLVHLADSLRIHFERFSDIAVLREAVDIGRRAVRAAADDPQRHVPLTTLGTALRLLYRRTGVVALLDEATEVSRTAVEAGPRGVVEAALLANYSAVLHDRVERTGDQAMLNEAIAVTRRAASASPDGSPMRLSCLYNVANLLYVQFERAGDVRALDEAIEVARAVVDATPPEHPDAPLHQGLLVRQLRARFEVRGDIGALDEAIARGHEGVNALPAGHVNRSPLLANLAVAVQARAEHTGDLAELRQVVGLKRAAARSAAGDGVHEALALSNLTSSLGRLAERTGDPDVRTEAVTAGRIAVARVPEGHPARATCEINLAGVLAAGGAIDEAVELLAAAARRPTAQPSVRIAAAQDWGRLALLSGRAERALAGYTLAVELLPRLATRALSRADASRWLGRYTELASDAAACALAAGRPERAIELLELGRGVLLAQAFEARSDLTGLREADAELADRFEHLCARLDAAAEEESPDQRREHAVELDELLARIRSLPGQDRFLRSPDVATLAAQAHGGPIVVVNVSRYRSDAIIVTTGGVLVQTLSDVDPEVVTRRQAAMRDALDSRPDSPGARQKAELAMLDTLAWLWDAVAGPVLERLGMRGGDPLPRIWWVPCGPLAALPLHAAGRHREQAGPDRDTVLDRAVSSYTPTIRALAHSRARRAPSRSGPPGMLAVVMPRTPGTTDLPSARREFKHVSRHFPAVTDLIGPAATRDAVLSALPGSPWAHFACHATSDPDDPSRGQLLVHDHADHPLRVVEMSRLRLTGTEFAYLSACGTAVTATHLANESIHVVSACQLAGYPHVVGTLWEISDEFAATVAERVYTDLADGGYDAGRSAGSLHRAVRSARDSHRGEPTLWAAYVHAGP